MPSLVERNLSEPNFDTPRYPKNEWCEKLYLKWGLGFSPSLARIETIAVSLLDSRLIMKRREGAGLVLGREVKDDELEIIAILTSKEMNKQQKFAALLLLRRI